MRTVRVRGVISHDDKFLFVQHKHDASFWALPGGKVEEGETLEAAMNRELIEELGVEPKIGKVLYIHQLFRGKDESMEFFFEILNGDDYIELDLQGTTHGMAELARAAFIDPKAEYVLPEFVAGLPQDIARGEWPRLLVRNAIR